VSVSWLSITALRAGLTSLIFCCNLRSSSISGTFHLKPDFPTMLTSKKQFYHLFNKSSFNIKQHSYFDILLFGTGSVCPTLELLCNSLCGPQTKIFGDPCFTVKALCSLQKSSSPRCLSSPWENDCWQSKKNRTLSPIIKNWNALLGLSHQHLTNDVHAELEPSWLWVLTGMALTLDTSAHSSQCPWWWWPRTYSLLWWSAECHRHYMVHATGEKSSCFCKFVAILFHTLSVNVLLSQGRL